MKIITKISIVCLLTLSTFGYSQNFEPSEDRVEYDDETAECWKITLAPKDKDIKKAFKKFMKKRYDVKLKKKRDIMKAEDVTISKISAKRINFYASIVDEDGQTEMKVFGNYGYSLFFNKDKQNNEYKAIRGIMVEFMQSYLPEYYQEGVEDATKRYGKFIDEDKSLNKKIERNKQKVEKNKQKIEDLKKDIEDLKSENEGLALKVKENNDDTAQSKAELVKTQENLDDLRKQLNSIKK